MDVSSIMGSFRKGFHFANGKVMLNICILSQKACDSIDEAFIESVTEDDYNYAVSQVIIGPEKRFLFKENSDDEILELIRKIHVKLEESPVTIMPFIKSCTRNAYFYSILKYWQN